MLWGTTGTAQHFAPAPLSPYWVGGLRMVMAALFFVALALLLDRGHARQPMRWARIVFCGLCMAIYNLSFFAGVKASGVALGTALAIGSGPIWAGLMQAVVHKRMPSPQWWLGTCTGVGGGIVMALAATDRQHLPWAGMALCLLAGLSYAAYALVNQALVLQSRVATVNAWVFACAALLSLPVSAWLGGPLQISADGWAVVIAQQLAAAGAVGVEAAQQRQRAAFALAVGEGLAPGGTELEEWVGFGAGDGIGPAQARRQGHRDDFAEGVLVVAGGEFHQGQPVGGQGRRFALDRDDGLEALDRQLGGVGQGDDEAGLLATPEGHPHAPPEIARGDALCRVIKALGQRNGQRYADDGGAHGRFCGAFCKPGLNGFCFNGLGWFHEVLRGKQS